MSDDELRKLVNDGIERVLDRLSSIEGEVRNLRQEHATTREMVTRLPATILAIFEEPMLKRMTAIERRLSKLDGQP